jgi:hypothetical protein
MGRLTLVSMYIEVSTQNFNGFVVEISLSSQNARMLNILSQIFMCLKRASRNTEIVF